jgi:hypothetical protein
MIDLVWCGRLGCEGGQSRLEESSRWLATYLLKIGLVFLYCVGVHGVFFYGQCSPMLFVAYGCIYCIEVSKSQTNTNSIFFFQI